MKNSEEQTRDVMQSLQLGYIQYCHRRGSRGPLRSRLRTFNYSSSLELHLQQPSGRAGPAGGAASSGETADVEAMEFGRERLVF